jgi:branched-subunit amino acid aminotransferase/4-amino-4-deoxychorismate lyase
MHSRIIYNNRLIEVSKVRLPLTSATLYGHGIFTTLAIYKGSPFMWPAHWLRISEHAELLKIDLSKLNETKVSKELERIIKANRVQSGRARITLIARSGKGAWNIDLGQAESTDLLIMTGNNREDKRDGLTLTISPYHINTQSPLTGIKSINYLDHILSWEEAKCRDFDEAVRLNEKGELVSATLSNLFWIKDGTLYTPSLSTGCLPGTTRSCIIQLAQQMGIPIIEGIYGISQLIEADEIFLTSSGLGVGIVTTFDFHRYTIAVGSIALRLYEAFRQFTIAT